MTATGTLIGISLRTGRRQPMVVMPSVTLVAGVGILGDGEKPRHEKRQVTVLAIEDWRAALADLNARDMIGGIDLDWTERRANLLVEGLRLPRARGAVLRIGGIGLLVTGQTFPCSRMDAVHPGLLKALGRDWRGGVTCQVTGGGGLAAGVPAGIVSSPREVSADRWPG
jgi:MOSC domain-containing protein YiiM